MAAKRVTQANINWDNVAKVVDRTKTATYIAFKAKSDGYLRRVHTNPENPPKIDWAYYKSNAANKAIVEQFEKAYTALKIPYPSDGGAVKAIETEEKNAMEDIKVFIERSNERIKKYEKEIQAFKDCIPLEEMSMEEVAYAYPEFSIDSLNKPTIWPHNKEMQHTPEDLEFFRNTKKLFHGPDKYHP